MDIEQKSKALIDEAMKDVIQELLVIDDQGASHMAYIHRVYWDNGLKVEFSTPDSDKEALIPLVHDAILNQISDIPKPELTLWNKFKNAVVNFFHKFAFLG